jgi:hypothetical protein
MKTSKIISTLAVLFFLVSAVTASTSGEIIKTLKSKSLNHITVSSSHGALSSNYQSLVSDNVSESMLNTDYSYLKFDVTSFKNVESESNETMELPNLDIEYLRFDATNYMDSNEINQVQISELPVNEYGYLMFDVNKYTTDIPFTPNFGEMPSTNIGL